jgi:hypothetical protein
MKTSYFCALPNHHPVGLAKIFTRLSMLTILPKPNSRKRRVWQAAMLGMIGGAVAAVSLIEAFAKACN